MSLSGGVPRFMARLPDFHQLTRESLPTHPLSSCRHGPAAAFFLLLPSSAPFPRPMTSVWYGTRPLAFGCSSAFANAATIHEMMLAATARWMHTCLLRGPAIHTRRAAACALHLPGP